MPAVGLSASDDDFYQRLYRRGMTHFAAADYTAAFAELRSAAFGFVERVDQFETSQSYAAVAAHRLGHDNDARDSLIRIVTAEKLQSRYRSLKLPENVRAEVDSLAAHLLTAQEAKLLDVTVVSKPPTVVPTPSKQPNVAATAPADEKSFAPAQSDSNPRRPPAAASSADASLREAQRAVETGEIDHARSIYNALLDARSLGHGDVLRVAEGLYIVEDFAAAACAFQRAGALTSGEEHDHYYYSVALYEMGRYGDAKRELAEALPYIAVTPEVARYRLKINAAR
jgi:tetratricopeptide (TPR) repeat protein